MPSARHRQPSFVGGELSPQLSGRYDLARFNVSVAKARNMIVTPQGSLLTRPGFRKCGISAYGNCRLVPFIFNSTEAAVLEFTSGKMRVWLNGALVVSSGTTPYELVTEWTNGLGDAKISNLRFIQSADVMTVVGPHVEPRELRRIAWNNWQIADLTYAPRLSAPTGLTHYNGNTTHDDKRAWEWVVTSVDSTTGEESAPSAVYSLTVYLEASAVDKRLKLAWTPVSGVTEYNVYRGRNGFFGFIGTAKDRTPNAYGKWEFNDDNFSPVYGSPPPKTDSPFGSSGNYPACGCYFEQRMVLARTDNNPQTFWASQSGAFKSFAAAEPPRDDDAIKYTIASQRLDEIRALFPVQSLIVFTAGGSYVINPKTDMPLTPMTALARPVAAGGISKTVEPLAVGEGAIYVGPTGRSVHDMTYSWADSAYRVPDLSVVARHLLEDRSIVSWAYQQHPTGIVWMQTSDGKLIGLTLLRDQEVWAWHRHDLSSPPGNRDDDDAPYDPTAPEWAQVVSLTVIPENGEDVLYVAVAAKYHSGTSAVYIMRSMPYRPNDSRSSPALDHITSTTPSYFSARIEPSIGSYYRAGDIHTITSDKAVFGSAINKTLVFSGKYSTVKAKVTSVTSAYQCAARLDRDVPPDLQNVYTDKAAICFDSMNVGITEYGNGVSLVSDGEYVGSAPVFNGTVTFTDAQKGALVHAGTPFRQEVRTFGLHSVDQGPVSERSKAIQRVTLICRRASTVEVGENVDRLYPALGPNGAALPLYAFPPTEPLSVQIAETWSPYGALSVCVNQPEFFELNGLIREVLIGD